MTEKHTYRCGNCEYATDDRDDLPPLADLELRIESDDIMGAGECPECGAMVFDTTGRNHRASECFDELVASLKEIVTFVSPGDDVQFAEMLHNGRAAIANATR